MPVDLQVIVRLITPNILFVLLYAAEHCLETFRSLEIITPMVIVKEVQLPISYDLISSNSTTDYSIEYVMFTLGAPHCTALLSSEIQ